MKRLSIELALAAAGLATLAGCHAPAPSVRGLFAAAGPTRVAPPATNSFTVADRYYSEAANGDQASAQPLGISPPPPYRPPAGATSLSPPPSGGAVAATAAVSGGPPRSSGQGMAATDLSVQQGQHSTAGGRPMEISQLPSRAPSASAILLPGTINAFPRGAAATPPRASTDAWESRGR